MKNRIITAAILAAVPAFAQEAPAAPAAPAPAPAAEAPAAATAEQFEAAARKLMACVAELNAAMKDVKDTESADMASPKVSELVAKMNAISAENEKLGQPTQEIQDQVDKAIGAEYSKTMEAMAKTLQPLVLNGFYDSALLEEAIMPLFYGLAPQGE